MKDILDHVSSAETETANHNKWWAARRLRYNLILLSEFIVIYLVKGFKPTPENIGYLIAFTFFTFLFANLFYFSGQLTQTILKVITNGKHSGKSFQSVLYWSGTIFSVVVVAVLALSILRRLSMPALIIFPDDNPMQVF